MANTTERGDGGGGGGQQQSGPEMREGCSVGGDEVLGAWLMRDSGGGEQETLPSQLTTGGTSQSRPPRGAAVFTLPLGSEAPTPYCCHSTFPQRLAGVNSINQALCYGLRITRLHVFKVLDWWAPRTESLSVTRDPEFPSNMTSQRGRSVSPSRSTLTFFPLLLSSVRPSPARLCSPPHRVRGTEGWDLQRRVLLSRGFDQTQSQERSLTDC
ncbi:unnamed protein product [Pleuronectes platessa]|uniref:Uncharacterized protein n=1 Tax=Pleuronectes platessa TaxID=8262 RepID=A0A9N7VXJ7_PLEPL|nr:unnamed protein product [Pleuronectes platessa]